MSLRLGVLNTVPFAIPFETRAPLFRERSGQQYWERGPAQADGRTRISVKRGNVPQDGFDKLTGFEDAC